MPDYQVPSLESAINGPINFDPICPDESTGTDRRIRKTRQRLQAALLLLMKEEPLSQITMREVCRRADVGRSTPYSHFRDVEDILDQLEATFFQALTELLDAYPAHQEAAEKADWFVRLFILARRHGLYLDLLLACHVRPEFLARCTQVCDACIARSLDLLPSSWRVTFISGALFALVRQWVLSGCRETPEQMAQLTVDLLQSVA